MPPRSMPNTPRRTRSGSSGSGRALFVAQLAKDLRADIKALLPVLRKCGDWEPERDAKLKNLLDLLGKTHPNEKVLIFTQFADTAYYLERQLCSAGLTRRPA